MHINTIKHARHLDARLGIGAIYPNVSALVGQDLQSAFNQYLPPNDTALTEPDLTSWDDVILMLSSSKEERRLFNNKRRKDSRTLTNWWLSVIHRTDYPLQERMVLFWHNHFTSNMRKVRWPQLMLQQNQLFRQQALGSYADLLRAIFKDPAMLIYLDGQRNVRKQPNENFARELLELFTLGEGHYTEADIIAAARSFTGWRFNKKKGRVVFNKRLHDSGEKTFLGQTGAFNADDIIDIILEQPRCAEFMAEKFWHHFVSTATPDASVIESWAMVLRNSGYDITTLLETIVHSDAFWQEEHRGVLMKSPIELTLGMMRELQLDDFRAYQKLGKINNRLGQALFSPPDVKGWRGGNDWISNTSFVLRRDFIEKMLSENDEMMAMSEEVKALSNAQLAEWLLPIDPLASVPSTVEYSEALALLLQELAYQLR